MRPARAGPPGIGRTTPAGAELSAPPQLSARWRGLTQDPLERGGDHLGLLARSEPHRHVGAATDRITVFTTCGEPLSTPLMSSAGSAKVRR